jgi:hypothetical protein
MCVQDMSAYHSSLLLQLKINMKSQLLFSRQNIILYTVECTPPMALKYI